MGYILLYSVHLWAARSDRNSHEICVPSARAQTLWVATACKGALRPVQAALRAVLSVKVAYPLLPPIRAPHHFCPPMSPPRGPRPSHSRKGPISRPSNLKLTTSTPRWRSQLSRNETAAVSTFDAAGPHLHGIHPLDPMLGPSHHAGCTCHPPVHLYAELAHSELLVFFCRAVKSSVNISQNTHRIPPIAFPCQELTRNSV